jgi:hypothetical protein
MNVTELLATLRSEIQQIEEAIRALEGLDPWAAEVEPRSANEYRSVTESVDASKSDGLAVCKREA